MTRYLSLYGYFLIQRFKILMEYRLNFFIGSASTAILQAASLATIWVVMRQIPSLNGWNFYEVILIYGLLTMGESITHMFADNLWTIGWNYIRSGDFDRFLVRPIDPLFHLLADRFCHDGIGNFVTGALLIGVSMYSLHVALTPLRAIYILVAVISGGIIFIALNLITATSAFWLTESIPVTQVVFNMNEFAKYPLNIYHNAIRILLTWLIPYGFVSFYPASYLLGRDAGPVVWLSPVVATVFILIAYRVWLFGLRHYSGTGS
ncbi:MAG: ABC-2 family transporter protein [Chloroflexi bacterium]|nr:ABC-2 family transporter protein [Chloroflexota bacterium]